MGDVHESWSMAPGDAPCDNPLELRGEIPQSQHLRRSVAAESGFDVSARNSASPSPPNPHSRASPLKTILATQEYAKSALTPKPAHQRDDPSFHSFGNSFDMLSETDQFSLSDRGVSPHQARRSLGVDGGRSRLEGILSPDETGANRGIKANPTDNTDNLSFSDISPIKLVYHSNGTLTEVGRSDDSSRHDGGIPALRNRGAFSVNPFGSEVIAESTSYLGGAVSISNPFYVLRCVQGAFQGCKYLLPCLVEPDICPVNLSKSGPFHHCRGDAPSSPASIEMKVAARRVETAVCAFGGYLDPLSSAPRQDESPPSTATSIFRLRGDTLQRQIYAESLPKRYKLSGTVVSWEVEEDPPVTISSEADPGGQQQGRSDTRRRRSDGSSHDVDANSATSNAESVSTRHGDSSNKLKYRCKLCGQVKQNHVCPYRHSLHRSIGVMVYPAVNSYTAAEPGAVAPPLSHMNNFVSYDSTHSVTSPAADAYSQAMLLSGGGPPADHPFHHQLTVTPASVQTSAVTFHSPQSSLSQDHSDEGGQHRTPPLSNYPPAGKLDSNVPTGGVPCASRASKTRSNWKAGWDDGPNPPLGGTTMQRSLALNHAPQPHPESIFVASVLLRPEHYRAVTPRPAPPGSSDSRGDGGSGGDGGAYRYPVIPLTFAERKRLSDSLFCLSQELPTSTEDCAQLLREARMCGEWDRAVAELLTQVVVGLYCGEGDACLDGLQQYLLGLGIAC